MAVNLIELAKQVQEDPTATDVCLDLANAIGKLLKTPLSNNAIGVGLVAVEINTTVEQERAFCSPLPLNQECSDQFFGTLIGWARC